MKYLFRFMIKSYAFVWYLFKYRNLPHKIILTNVFGIIRINNNYFIYDTGFINNRSKEFESLFDTSELF